MLAEIAVVIALQLGLTALEVQDYADAQAAAALPAPSPNQPSPRVAPCEFASRSVALRSVEKWMNRLIDDGLRRSPTFARLAGSIEKHRAIVYVEPRNALKAGLLGAVPPLVTRTPDGIRYMRVWVLQGRQPDEMIETIGHELQHVLELLETEGTGDASDARLNTSRGT